MLSKLCLPEKKEGEEGGGGSYQKWYGAMGLNEEASEQGGEHHGEGLDRLAEAEDLPLDRFVSGIGDGDGEEGPHATRKENDEAYEEEEKGHGGWPGNEGGEKGKEQNHEEEECFDFHFVVHDERDERGP